MSHRRQIYEGKAKILYEGPEPGTIIQYFKDDATAFNALTGVNVDIARGAVTAFIGPSGCGKSTLLYVLSTMDTEYEGQLLIDQEEMPKKNEPFLAKIRNEKIGFVFQSFNLLPRTTVLRNVMLPLLYTDTTKEEREKRARQCLKYAGLEENKYLNLSNQLSGW